MVGEIVIAPPCRSQGSTVSRCLIDKLLTNSLPFGDRLCAPSFEDGSNNFLAHTPLGGRMFFSTGLFRSVGIALLAALAATRGYAATLSISPDSGPPRSEVTFSGAGFASLETVDLVVDSKVFAKATADGEGNFVLDARVPRRTQPGSYLVKAVGESSGDTAQQSFTVATNWKMFKGGPARVGFNPVENTITPNNAKFLILSWVGVMGDLVDSSSPAVVDGVAYVASFDGNLYAFDADGCGQEMCQPLWSGATQNDIVSSPAVANGVVYIGSADHNLYAFDAKGCGKSSCAPLWIGPTGSAILYGSPVVANGVVFVGSGDKKLYAFKAAGCGQNTCQPLWTAQTGDHIYSPPAVSAGVVYVGSDDGKLYAFNAKGCGQNSCQPLWTGATGASIDGSGPAIANGVVYVGSFDHFLYAFNAAGCGGSTCQPLWKGQTGDAIQSSPSVANGFVYVGSDDALLDVFSAAGCGQSVCKPLWLGEAVGAQAAVISSPTIANGLVYVGENDGAMLVFKASGCGQFVCLPVNQLLTNNEQIVSSSPAVVNGTVYFGSADQLNAPIGRLYVFKPSRR